MHKVTIKYKVVGGVLDIVVIAKGRKRMYTSVFYAAKDLEADRIISIRCDKYEK